MNELIEKLSKVQWSKVSHDLMKGEVNGKSIEVRISYGFAGVNYGDAAIGASMVVYVNEVPAFWWDLWHSEDQEQFRKWFMTKRRELEEEEWKKRNLKEASAEGFFAAL